MLYGPISFQDHPFYNVLFTTEFWKQQFLHLTLLLAKCWLLLKGFCEGYGVQGRVCVCERERERPEVCTWERLILLSQMSRQFTRHEQTAVIKFSISC